MDSTVITQNACTEKLRILCEHLRRQKEYFAESSMYWDRFCKRKIRQLFEREQAERRREHRMMENHVYECLYDVLQRHDSSEEKLRVLHHLKAQIVRIRSIRLQKILPDNSYSYRPDGRKPTIYHVLQTKRRGAERTIYRLRDEEGQMHTTPTGIARTLTNFLRKMYDRIEADEASVTILVGYPPRPANFIWRNARITL